MDKSIWLSTSPTAVVGSPVMAFHLAAAQKELEQKKTEEQDMETNYAGFEDFLCKIPDVIQQRKEVNAPPGSKEDPVHQLFEYVFFFIADDNMCDNPFLLLLIFFVLSFSIH